MLGLLSCALNESAINPENQNPADWRGSTVLCGGFQECIVRLTLQPA
jgi:hypothetical protein